MTNFNRREWLAVATSAAAATVGSQVTVQGAEEERSPGKFRFCLNTGTIRGQNLGIVREIEVASKAGYDGIEPWLRTINEYVAQGGTLKDLKKRLEDSGLKLESAIAFAQWIVNDPDKRKAALEEAKRDMDVMAQLGGTRIAAPPAGANDDPNLPLPVVAERYRALLEVGAEIGVTPQLEVWGFSKVLSRLGEAAYVAVEAGHPNSCILGDVYHIYKGGTDFNGLRQLSGVGMHVFHMNDYPANPPRETITDADRVYTGDGVAPLAKIMQTFREIGFEGALSLELFNRSYWERDALEVAKTGLEKMKQTAAL
ncbi:MAG: sugar phosphate isomerase/epimerase [Planctomycetaceae bacterium]|nr:sugar phosphate isomerase/epimerase [Planctomycetaceae bacterium]